MTCQHNMKTLPKSAILGRSDQTHLWRDCLMRKPANQHKWVSGGSKTRPVCEVHLPGHHRGLARSQNHSHTTTVIPPLCLNGAVRLSFPPHGAKPWGVQNEEKQGNKRWTRKGRELVERVWYVHAQNGKPMFHKCHNQFVAVLSRRHIECWLTVGGIAVLDVRGYKSQCCSLDTAFPYCRLNPFTHKGFFIFQTNFLINMLLAGVKSNFALDWRCTTSMLC